jgi:hypothetical protein
MNILAAALNTPVSVMETPGSMNIRAGIKNVVKIA